MAGSGWEPSVEGQVESPETAGTGTATEMDYNVVRVWGLLGAGSSRARAL